MVQGLPSVGSNAGSGSLDFLRNSPQVYRTSKREIMLAQTISVKIFLFSFAVSFKIFLLFFVVSSTAGNGASKSSDSPGHISHYGMQILFFLNWFLYFRH